MPVGGATTLVISFFLSFHFILFYFKYSLCSAIGTDQDAGPREAKNVHGNDGAVGNVVGPGESSCFDNAGWRGFNTGRAHATQVDRDVVWS
jgi:hypothetical protein